VVNGESTQRVLRARSKRDGTGNGMGFVPSALRHYTGEGESGLITRPTIQGNGTANEVDLLG
jgi:hypothetical protein